MGGIAARLAKAEKAMGAADGGACTCSQVRGHSGLRIIWEEGGALLRGQEHEPDDVAVCQVCGRPRATFRVVFGEVENWRAESPPIEAIEAAIEASRGMLDLSE
jgi:hypothetical protein